MISSNKFAKTKKNGTSNLIPFLPTTHLQETLNSSIHSRTWEKGTGEIPTRLLMIVMMLMPIVNVMVTFDAVDTDDV